MTAGTAPLPVVPMPAPLSSGPELFAAHPLHRRRHVELPGGRVEIRPVLPGDAPAIDRFVRDLSLASRHRRFHSPIRGLTAGQLAGIVDVDHRSRESLVAFRRAGRRNDLLAFAQYVSFPDPPGTSHDRPVDVAIVVADPWQGRGLGRALAGQLVEAIREAGIGALSATVLADNEPALALLRGLGLPTVARSDGTTIELLVSLEQHDDYPAPCRTAAMAG